MSAKHLHSYYNSKTVFFRIGTSYLQMLLLPSRSTLALIHRWCSKLKTSQLNTAQFNFYHIYMYT